LGHVFNKNYPEVATEFGNLPNTRQGFAGGWGTWQQSDSSEPQEIFADTYLGWVFGNTFAQNEFGIERMLFMYHLMGNIFPPPIGPAYSDPINAY
jgi:hypothetical protein